MSAISELRARVAELEGNVDELHTRLTMVESILLNLIKDGKGMQEFHSERHEIGEVRSPIGFKTRKRN